MKNQLKPCPFCGSSAAIELLDNNQYYPRCTGGVKEFCLMARTPDFERDGFTTYERAEEVWNTRKLPSYLIDPADWVILKGNT